MGTPPPCPVLIQSSYSVLHTHILIHTNMSSAGGMVMSPIKVIIKHVEVPTRPPIPDESFGDTMFIIDLMKQEREKEERLAKDEKILKMALERKKKKWEKSHCNCWKL